MRTGVPSKATIAEDVSRLVRSFPGLMDEPVAIAVPIAHVDLELPLCAIGFPRFLYHPRTDRRGSLDLVRRVTERRIRPEAPCLWLAGR